MEELDGLVGERLRLTLGVGSPGEDDRAEERLTDASPLVRAMAVWALGRLAGPPRVLALRDRHAPAEPDPAVRQEWRNAASASAASCRP